MRIIGSIPAKKVMLIARAAFRRMRDFGAEGGSFWFGSAPRRLEIDNGIINLPLMDSGLG